MRLCTVAQHVAFLLLQESQGRSIRKENPGMQFA